MTSKQLLQMTDEGKGIIRAGTWEVKWNLLSTESSDACQYTESCRMRSMPVLYDCGGPPIADVQTDGEQRVCVGCGDSIARAYAVRAFGILP
jgi:hypothetical protein